jgi:hypothetical protein
MQAYNTMKQHDLHKMDQYISGSLPVEDATAFENRLREDEAFRRQFEQIRFIIVGIQCAAIHEELDNIRLLYDFLEKGGVMLRAGIDEIGQHVIERLTFSKEWNVIMICRNSTNCNKLINRLVKNHPDKFRTLESISLSTK